ncbi:MAG: hypothetical protein OSA51_00205 [Octadecabacter sp.]|nr:hypothetical protein [Octadecabacter sp.]
MGFAVSVLSPLGVFIIVFAMGWLVRLFLHGSHTLDLVTLSLMMDALIYLDTYLFDNSGFE